MSTMSEEAITKRLNEIAAELEELKKQGRFAVDQTGAVGGMEQSVADELQRREEQEQIDLMTQHARALGKSDWATCRELMKKIKLSPGALMAIKELDGADYIREKGYNTEKADRKFGPGWLDR